MNLIKVILKLEGIRIFICWLGFLYIRFVFYTSTWKVIRSEIPKSFWDKKIPFILCFWHGRLLMMPYSWDFSQTINLLTSEHRDGQLIAKTVSHFGFNSISGSSSKGGFFALRSMLKCLSLGKVVGLTPDGPRGPRMRVSDGVINLARVSGAPIVPVTFSVNNGKLLETWDKFLIAFPFCKGVFVWGPPIPVARNASIEMREKARKAVEEGLMEVTNEADTLFGRTLIEPSIAINGKE